ncbi:MAG: DNA primase small subunit domain-containing protein [Thermoplasmata archaeon]
MGEEEKREATLRYLQAKFGQYYGAHPLRLPPRFGRREFGFILFEGGFVLRHLAFPREADLYRYIRSKSPAHIYHSAAYYEVPGAPTMGEKGWMGADLIFDLDADHIPGWQELGYRGMLDAVKAQVIRLIDDFLVPDLGFREEDLHLAFSGARGYHIHVRDPRVFTLESHERREIVDYITGTGLDLQIVGRREPFEERTYGDRTRTLKRFRIPAASDPGWRGRTTRGVVRWLEELADLPEGEAIDALRQLEGVGPIRARKIYDTLHRLGRDRARARVEAGLLDFFPPGSGPSLVAQGVEYAKGATDEPVTSDTKRLIRLMGSLHGKTGLRVVPLTRDELDAFDPLTDAVPDLYAHEKIRVATPQAIDTDMMGETFNLEPGQNSVPEYLAIFLMCRGVATLTSGTAGDGTQGPT